jgi:L-serine dehydratase
MIQIGQIALGLYGFTPQDLMRLQALSQQFFITVICGPMDGLVQGTCTKKCNGLGTIKAYMAASLVNRGTRKHLMPLDQRTATMKHADIAMSEKFKETSLEGLAVSITECQGMTHCLGKLVFLILLFRHDFLCTFNSI